MAFGRRMETTVRLEVWGGNGKERGYYHAILGLGCVAGNSGMDARSGPFLMPCNIVPTHKAFLHALLARSV